MIPFELPLIINQVTLQVLVKRKGKWKDEIMEVPSGAITGTTLKLTAHKKMIVKKAYLQIANSNLKGDIVMDIYPVDLLVNCGDTLNLDFKC